jgi:SAM-dependent methyltransferase
MTHTKIFFRKLDDISGPGIQSENPEVYQHRLNLGIGPDRRTGYTNVDAFAPSDFAWDLGQFHWPWTDNSIDEVLMNHVLEHMIDMERTVREIHRILKPGGLFHGQVPFGWSDNGITEYGHCHLFHWHTFKSMEPVGFKCILAEPSVLSRSDLNHNLGRSVRNLIPFRRILSRFLVNMFDVINFRLEKI